MRVRLLLRRLRQLVAPRPGRHSAAHLATGSPARPPLPTTVRSPPAAGLASMPPPVPHTHPVSHQGGWAVVYRDPPTLRLPRIPAEDRAPIFWDTDPAPPYIPHFFRARTEVTR